MRMMRVGTEWINPNHIISIEQTIGEDAEYGITRIDLANGNFRIVNDCPDDLAREWSHAMYEAYECIESEAK